MPQGEFKPETLVVGARSRSGAEPGWTYKTRRWLRGKITDCRALLRKGSVPQSGPNCGTGLTESEHIMSKESKSCKIIDRKIGTLANRAKAFNQTSHELFVMCLEHAETYNNATKMLDAVSVFIEHANRENIGKVGEWLRTYGPVWVKPGAKDKKCGIRKPTDKQFKPFDIEAARFTPWFKLDVEGGQTLTVFKPSTMVNSILNGMRTKVENACKKSDEGSAIVLGSQADWDSILRRIESVFTEQELAEFKASEARELEALANPQAELEAT